MLDEQVLVEERELDRVCYLFYLPVQAADVLIGNVGHLFEHEFFHFGPGQLFEQKARARVHKERVPRPQLLAHELLGDLDNPLFVGPADDYCPVVVFEDRFHRDDLAGEVAPTRQHDVQRLVQHYFLATLQLVVLQARVERDPHLAAA